MTARILARHLLSGLLLLASLPATAGVELPGPLVNADWLMQNLGAVHLLDVRMDTDSFLKDGHIEDAVLVDARKIRVKREQDGKKLIGMLPVRKEYEQFMSEHGVGNDSTVIITHQGGKPGHAIGAARLYWQMKYYGFERVAILDGGNRAWVDALGDLSTDATAAKPAMLVAGKPDYSILATEQDVIKALKDEHIQLVDTRSLRFHIGLEKRDYVYAYGHIPTSRLLPYSFIFPEKGVPLYNDSEQIQQVLQALGIEDDKALILYCNSAYECSAVWFALHELAGNQDVRIYDGALNEWTQTAGNPMTRRVDSELLAAAPDRCATPLQGALLSGK